MTTEVVEAACSCLVAQAEEAERLRHPEVVQERMVLEEFGRCIMQVIESANKTRGRSSRCDSILASVLFTILFDFK